VCRSLIPSLFMPIVLEQVTTATDDARTLLDELDAELNASYAPEQRHGLNLAQLFRPAVLFFVARLDGGPVGCGGIAFEDGLAEVKRMYVRAGARGRGVAPAILARLEHEARGRGVGRISLETGDAQHAAIRFYERAGFARCTAFGAYATMPPHAIERSVFFDKLLATSESGAISSPVRMITLQPITPSIVATFKTVRLRALSDTPSAFGSTYARESAQSDDDWLRRAAQCDGERSRGLLAFDGDDPCGIAIGVLKADDASHTHLYSMWVAPTHRGRGVGRLLVTGIIDWARSRRARTLNLTVTSNNQTAMRFYEGLGFAKTGRTEPYPNDPALVEFEMIRRLDHGEEGQQG
jgi:GNAT superfamily N-acetyltransferase